MKVKSTWSWVYLTAGVVSLIAGLGSGPASCDPMEGVELSFFHTNDLHYQLHPVKADHFGLGGMAKLSTLLNRLRAESPLHVTLDAGDWSEGNWYFNLDAGVQMLQILEQMKFDAAVVGNHDYLSGPNRLIDVVSSVAPRLPVLGANFQTGEFDGAERFRQSIPGTLVLERGGLKIGVIGLSTVDYVYSFWLNPVKVSEPIAVAQAQARVLRPLVDVLILLSHNSFSLNVQAARAVFGIDAVISGHSHRKIAEAVFVENAGRQVPVVETGSWGRYLGQLRLRVNPKSKKVTFSGYQIHPVTPDLESDPNVTLLVDQVDADLTKLYGGDVDAQIGETLIDVRHDDSRVANLGDIASQSYLDRVGGDFAMEQLSLTGIRLKAGPISVRDAHDILPHIFDFDRAVDWTIKKVSVAGVDVARLMNVLFFAQSNEVPIIGTGDFSHAGLELDWNPPGVSGDRASIREIRVGNVRLDPTRTYRLVVTDGVLLALKVVNSKLNLGLDLTRVEETGIEGWRAIESWIRKATPLSEEKLRSGTRTRPYSVELGVAHYGISFDAQTRGVRVEIYNDGLLSSVGGILKCFAGLPNDPVSVGTSLQVWSEIGVVPLAPLPAGEKRVMTLPWDPSVLGRWPVKCDVTVGGAERDPVPSNDEAENVLLVSERLGS